MTAQSPSSRTSMMVRSDLVSAASRPSSTGVPIRWKARDDRSAICHEARTFPVGDVAMTRPDRSSTNSIPSETRMGTGGAAASGLIFSSSKLVGDTGAPTCSGT